ncbi:hypothetical protein PUNSTDRAFT_132168 [Punctularia strigosozonata HHB-11173 SS5]|uniref:uncharacterized protein n=1 Tax=Punctularia strigosozonata (strain HHB-11173) TaxID=741275 RepID=UPI00044166E5|nr:uncharacterized protein PUNSTDRAFT_132168 [Punctularia strigosozonata HHB-11173 SS5]EIN12035.1 hypothetical protein PUNSTDRAFT_132168 [Punctularia strigosozonata HHB-11173 SS5]
MPSSTTPDQQRHGHDHTLAVLSDLDYALLAEERVPDVAVLRTLEDGSVLCLNREGNVGLVTMSTGEATDLSQDVEIIGLVGVHRRLAVLHRDVSGVVDSLLVSNHRVQQIAQSCPLIKSWNHSGSGGEYDAKWKPPSTLVSALEAMELLHQSLESWLTWSPIKAVLKCEYINRCLGDISSLFMEQVDDTALNHVLTGVVPALDAIFSSEELMKEMMLLEDIKAQEFINLLDEARPPAQQILTPSSR